MSTAAVEALAILRFVEVAGRALRVLPALTKWRQDGFAAPKVTSSARPAGVAVRAIRGHWEGDLTIGSNKSAMGR